MFRLAIHAGAGGASGSRWPTSTVEAARTGLLLALRAGHGVLATGGAAIEAVVEAVAALEDCPVFNAGRGAALRSDGTIALDASVMSGPDRSAGAVAGVSGIRNPIRAAEAVRRDGRHVLLLGESAVRLARSVGLPIECEAYFFTDERRAQLALALARGETMLDHGGQTVGAVALDAQGHVAAATSTGGITAASPGRVGDSPLVGAGTWADDLGVAVSGTGLGEAFIRAAFAHEVDARVRLARAPLHAACEAALDIVSQAGGSGGCIAVEAGGAVALCARTPLMPRGVVDESGVPRIALEGEEPLAGGEAEPG